MSTLNVEKITASNGIVLPSYATGNYPVGTQGQVIFDSTTKEIKVFNGSTWDGLFPQYFADILIVGGGGGGGSSFGGGGGGGGVIYLRGYPLYKGQTFTVEVGAGGAGRPNETDTGIPADSGQRSGFGIHYAAGGGGGGGRGGGAAWGQPANPGGSGGGAGHSNSSPRGIPGEGIPGQGFMGGWGRQDVPSSHHAAGGGGGAAQTGGDHRDGISGGKGGNGIAYDISGTLTYYAGGGGGGVYTTMTGGAGGAGGGGEGGRYQSGQLTSGVSATGYGSGGGGGGYTYGGGNGSAGIVIIRYSGSQRGSGGSVSASGGYTRHTFTTTGSFTYTA